MKSLDAIPLLNRRQSFLHGLTGDGAYKRYKGSPLRYAGGKSRAAGYVIEHMPDVQSMMSPFVGGASLEIACAKELGMQVSGFDIFGLLVNYWRVQLDDPEGLARRLALWRPTPHQYDAVKRRLGQHWSGEAPIADPLDLAAHYWFNHNLSYGPIFLGWMSRIYSEEDRYERLVARVRKFRCPTLSVEEGAFEDTIPAHGGQFLYCDPPYYLSGDSTVARAIYPRPDEPIYHAGFRHDLLRDLLRAHSGGFVLSYNDCATIREWYKDYEIVDVAWQYTMGQGATPDEDKRGKPSSEIIIIG